MVIDSSALLAIIGQEPEASRFIELLAEAGDPVISAATLLEAKIVAQARLGPAGAALVDRLLKAIAARVVAVDEHQAEVASEAWRRYGKGNHPAGVNYGDCFSYALARTTEKPLLQKGDDFPQTDIAVAGLAESEGN